jgi:methylated-DNA-[protein]-cysteine S-methyltransferase
MMRITMVYVSMFETKFGIGAVMATERGVCKVVLPDAGSGYPGHDIGLSGIEASPLTEQVAGMLKSYFAGEQQDFDDVPVDLGNLTEYRKRILLLIRAIPSGEVRSYGEVAAMSGDSRAARAIGGAMASNPVPVIIPCHRVVAGNGKLTGFTAPGGLAVKKILLMMEGVEFKGEVVNQKKTVINKPELA